MRKQSERWCDCLYTLASEIKAACLPYQVPGCRPSRPRVSMHTTLYHDIRKLVLWEAPPGITLYGEFDVPKPPRSLKS